MVNTFMDSSSFIVAAYAISAVIICGMVLFTWISARRVRRQLEAADKS